MPASKNQAAYLVKAGAALEVRNAPMPTAGPGEIVVKNAAIAINPLDWHIQDAGVFVQSWPAIMGSDVAGVVHEVGAGVKRFKEGDRVIGHSVSFVSGRPQDGAFALYTVVHSDKAAILPDSIPFTSGVVVPFALEGAVCALSLKVPGVALPGVPTPALGLPYPSLVDLAKSLGKVLVVNGGSSSIGTATTQLAAAAGVTVISLVGKDNFKLSKSAGATVVLDHGDPSLVNKVVQAVRDLNQEFLGIFDAISIPDTYSSDLAILSQLGGGHLACSHPPPAEVPENVKAGMIFAVNDIATPVWNDYVTPALETGKLKCLPPSKIVGKGLGCIQEGLKASKAGVSGIKLVVEL
ncbi:chaperonin 10-like protein [Dendryphion nanum]|uniref:Chaperonin 10-like protein n=1 Tax=Dendryphion nanum TaxID=256645 RepID=A0A9P9I889_9PLEO|nr:chaperonin 10-like protein [Dendryphion nanum]